MNECENYSCIEFSGLALHPTFSIYLFEIERGKEKFFYIGITGDAHYPSARSILHRLAGHIDLGKKSTQSQFIKGLKEKVFRGKEKLTAEDWETIHIKLHHWAIPGFVTWEGDLKELDKNSEDYRKYKNAQNSVMYLEKKIIGDFGKRLLNKTKGNSDFLVEIRYLPIYNDIKNIIGYE